jgi:hypothetical protein
MIKHEIFSFRDLMSLAWIEDEGEFWKLFLEANENSSSTQEFSRKFALSLGDEFLKRTSDKFEKRFSAPHPDYERTDEWRPTFGSFENFMIHRATYNTFRHWCAKHFYVGIQKIECLEDLRGSKSKRKFEAQRDKFEKILENT